MSDDLNALVAEAELGDEARRFLDSDLGRCVIGMAQQQAQRAQEALGEVDPDDKKAIVALQNEIKLGVRFEQWLLELLHNGEAAMSIYQQEKQ